ncbi:MAG: glycerol kinase GlpK [Solirubrobacteraceae bacterium]|nr:glycerol kinase GlpK [Solirubrobacteraceae bacterium]
MAAPRYVAALDQGTTSTRCMLFDGGGRVVASAQREHEQLMPQPGWVEHDAKEIWFRSDQVIRLAMAQVEATAADVAALGITNQRETTVLWDRHTGEPLHGAITWQDTRTDELCVELARGDQDRFRATTGLPIAPYFSATKIMWLLDRIDGARERAEAGDLMVGTIDTWVLWHLTGGPGRPSSRRRDAVAAGRRLPRLPGSGPRPGLHITDVTNASRTLLMDLTTLDWDEGLLSQTGIPRRLLPEIRPSSQVYGEVAAGPLAGVPIGGILGDQQAATFGQTCFAPGEAKNTYGTGNFLLLNTGGTPVRSTHGLITTVGYQLEGGTPTYCLEGSIAITGALVQWLRDNLGMIGGSEEIETLASTVDDNGGCYFVPAFSGLYAPYWRSEARGVIAGLTRFVKSGHIARAVLEATAFQSREVVDAMALDAGVPLESLKVDGGMTVNELLMQFQADVLGVPVVRPEITETTALGAAYAAGLAVGLWGEPDDLRDHWHEDRRWLPQMHESERSERYRYWKRAVERTFDWLE